MKEEVILTILPHQLREVLKRENIDFQSIQEIRLRVGKPLILLYRGNEVIPEADGRTYYITKDEIREMLDYISGYSLYSYEREMSQGYITIEGGHRVGLSGQAIMLDRPMNKKAGTYSIPIKQQSRRLMPGAYIYRIRITGGEFTGKVILQ